MKDIDLGLEGEACGNAESRNFLVAYWLWAELHKACPSSKLFKKLFSIRPTQYIRVFFSYIQESHHELIINNYSIQ